MDTTVGRPRNGATERTTQQQTSNPAEENKLFVRCGLFDMKLPKVLQRCADPKIFTLILYIMGIVEAAYFTYFICYLSNADEGKYFAFENKAFGVVMIAEIISATIISIVVGYYGKNLLISKDAAACLTAVSILIYYFTILPGVILGPIDSLPKDEKILRIQERVFCDDNMSEKECSLYTIITADYKIIATFIANIFWGIGYTAYYTVREDYLDNDRDVKRKKDIEKLLGVAVVYRILFGPTFGFLLSSFRMRYFAGLKEFYEHPPEPWWLDFEWMGFFILTISIYLFTCLLIFFPREMFSRFRTIDSEKIQTLEYDGKIPHLLQEDVIHMYRSGTMSDFKLQVNSQIFSVHANILATRSSVFSRILEINMKEKNDNTLIIEDLSTDTVQQMLDYLYTDNVTDVTVESAVQLYYAADKYILVGLKQKISNFLKKSIFAGNLYDILELAYRHNDQDLKSHAVQYIFDHEKAIVLSDKFKSFSKNNPELALEIVSGLADCRYGLGKKAK